MKEEALELYRQGYTHGEIAEELGLATSTVGTYVYASGLAHDPVVRELRMRVKIKTLINNYEEEFNTKFN